MDQAPPESARRRRRRVIVWSLVGILVLVAAAGVWVASRAFIVRGELEAVAALRSELTQGMGESVGGLSEVVAEFDHHASRAAETADDVVWRATEIVPFVGPNLSAVRTVAESLDRIADEVAVPLAGLAGELGQRGLIDDGSLDLDFIRRAQAPVRSAADALEATERELAGVRRSQLVTQVVDGVIEVEALVESLSGVIGPVHDVTRMLPGLLGDEAPRSILVMLQNNAELRSGGGITGSFAELRAEGGDIRLVRQADSSEFGPRSRPILAVPESTTAIHGDIVGRFVQNATTTPDFDLSARLASAWWEDLTGRAPDTVIAVDPLVLRSLLTVTGPIVLDGGTRIERDGFMRSVMVDPYLTLDSSEQTRFFQQLTESYFAALMTSDASPEAWIRALAEPLEEGRISVWSAHGEEAEVLAGTSVAGPLARHLAAGDHAFAVYLNDTTGAKMDSSLTVELATAVGSCRADEQPQVAVRVHLKNEAPEDAGTAWPASMTGAGHWGVPAGEIGTSVAVAAPEGWFFGGTTVDGTRKGTVDVEDSGLPTSAVEVELAPGESAEIEVRFLSPTREEVTPQLLHTPMMRSPEIAEPAELTCD